MFEIIPLTREHLKALYGEEDVCDQAQNDLRISHGMGFAAVSEGKLIGAAGIGMLWPNTGVAWTILSDEIKERHKKSLHKHVLRLFPAIVEKMGLERVQTAAVANGTTECAWLERLGFTRESLMRKYLYGEDYVQYSWVKE